MERPMQSNEPAVSNAPKRTPWNKGKLVGAKPPQRSKHVWSIRTKLQVEGRARNLAMFNLAIRQQVAGAAASLPSRSRTLRQVGAPLIEQQYGRKRSADPLDSN
jgi:hypothetical protein